MSTTDDHDDEPRSGTHPEYVELPPLGPRDAGDAGGVAQIGTAYVRRFAHPLSSRLFGPGHVSIVDIECTVVNTETDAAQPARKFLCCTVSYTVCTDPNRVLETELTSYATSRIVTPDAGDAALTDLAAYRLCAEFDPATLSWDGADIER